MNKTEKIDSTVSEIITDLTAYFHKHAETATANAYYFLIGDLKIWIANGVSAVRIENPNVSIPEPFMEAGVGKVIWEYYQAWLVEHYKWQPPQKEISNENV